MAQPLTVGASGNDVAQLHEQLKRRGFEIPTAELNQQVFGPGTREAVLAAQRTLGLPATGEVDESTAAAVLSGTPPAEAAAAGIARVARAEHADLAGATAPRQPAMPVGTRGTAATTGENDDGGALELPEQTVTGQILLEQGGAPAANVRLRVYQRGFGGTATLLAETQTDARGAYETRVT